MRLRDSRSKRSLATVAVACALLIAAVAVSAATASQTRHAGSTAAAATPACATSGLVVWLDTEGSGAAGSSYYKLELTNLSGNPCTLRGFPGVSGVNLRGRQLGSAASRNHSGTPATVTLGEGASAVVLLRIVDVFNYSRSKCGPVTAAGLRVYPPDQTASKLVPFPFSACSRSGSNYLSVEAVKKA